MEGVGIGANGMSCRGLTEKRKRWGGGSKSFHRGGKRRNLLCGVVITLSRFAASRRY